MVRVSAAKPLNLALQGGGSHGALTWGVLDRLLEDERIDIVETSGTSAGAMNAVVLADGFAARRPRGGAGGAGGVLEGGERRGALLAGAADLVGPDERALQPRPLAGVPDDGGDRAAVLALRAQPVRPEPAARPAVAQVDFARVNAPGGIVTHVTATNVRTGLPRVFSTGEITADAVLASACLPQMYKAVEIGGEAYWDGGFSANPALFPLVANTASPDILIVQINPFHRRALPRTARDIINRVNEISFNTSLVKELRTLALARRIGGAGASWRRPGVEPVFLHLVHVDEEVQDLVGVEQAQRRVGLSARALRPGAALGGPVAARQFRQHRPASTFDVEELFEKPAARPAELPPALET